jgi:hypothetical protein
MKRQEVGENCIKRSLTCTPPSIIRMIKLTRMRWAGHVARMRKQRNEYRILWESQEERDHEEDQDVGG